MKRFLIFLLLFICGPGYTAQIVNVEYIHNAIQQKWDIAIPYNPELSNPRIAANMKYLLTAIDVANETLNGGKTTDYGNGEYATTIAADTIATDAAVDGLVQVIEKDHLIMTVGPTAYNNDVSSYVKFEISAAGTFYIDWGDGTTESIEKTTTDPVAYSHTYKDTDRIYTVRLKGRATAYNPNDVSAFVLHGSKFEYPGEELFVLKSLDGCLGCVFPTLADGSQPLFKKSFFSNAQVDGKIPAGFLAGIHGTPRENMFDLMFAGSTFSGIGAPLFDDLSGGLSGHVFFAAFRMASLKGPSAMMKMSDGTLKYLYEVYPDATYIQVGACYYGATGLDDYTNMPKNWTYWDV